MGLMDARSFFGTDTVDGYNAVMKNQDPTEKVGLGTILGAIGGSANKNFIQPPIEAFKFLSSPEAQQFDAQGMPVNPNKFTQSALDLGLGMTGINIGKNVAQKGVGGLMVDPSTLSSMGLKDAEKQANFNNWFGDSKVVDADGKPLTVYHGTDADFDSFSKKSVGNNFGLDKEGFFFTTDKGSANRSRGSYPDKPKYRFDEQDTLDANGGRIIESNVSINKPVDLSLVKGFDFNSSLSPTGNFDQNRDVLIKALKKQGADGIIISSQGEKMVVAVEPTQIKATSNRGTYDPNDPNMLRSQFAPVGLMSNREDNQ